MMNTEQRQHVFTFLSYLLNSIDVDIQPKVLLFCHILEQQPNIHLLLSFIFPTLDLNRLHFVQNQVLGSLCDID